MAKVKQPYGEPRIVPWLDDQVVNPGQVVDIPDDRLPNFLEAGWPPADAATKKAADELAKAKSGVSDEPKKES